MNRRVAGLMVVLLTIVGVVVVQAPSRLLGGQPTAVRFPGTPAVGDCLIDPTDGATPFPLDLYRQVPQFGTCADHRTLAEVVAVRSPAPDDLAPGWDGSTGCRTEALIRAGLVRRDGSFGLADQVPDDAVSWQYSIAADTAWIGQIPWSPRASAWAACVVRPIGLNTDVGSIAGSFAGGVLPDEFGTCWKSRDVDAAMRIINCTLPHAAELIALGKVADAPNIAWEHILSSCTQQAGRVMRRDDPTAGGLLSVHVVPNGTNSAGQARDLVCFITADDDRRLMGSIVGLGTEQVRFAG